VLRAVLVPELPASCRTWVEQVLEGQDEAALRAAFARSGVELADQPWVPTFASGRTLADNGLGWIPIEIDLATAVRVLILVRAANRSPAAPALVDGWYAAADASGQCAVLRSLSLLPYPKRFLRTAIEGTRSRDVRVFRAIAVQNPYPSMFFSDSAMDDLLERVASERIALAGVLGVEERALARAMLRRDALAAVRQSTPADDLPN